MGTQFQDPRGEYSKKCPYCLQLITVNHLNRDYCTEKNGIKDFCKNRYRRLKDNLNASGIVIDKPESKPLKININNDRLSPNNSINDQILETVVISNKRILKDILGSEILVELDSLKLFSTGYEINVFEFQYDTPSGIQVFKIGQFGIVKTDDNTFVIVLFNNLEL